MIKYIAILSIVLLCASTYGQVKVVPLTSSQKVIDYSQDGVKKKKRSDESLRLPFFDDFSDSWIYPSSELWIDRNVLINTNGNSLLTKYLPPSVGSATFDAIDEYGKMYDVAVYNNSFTADTLTSAAINLDIEDEDNKPLDPASVFLSFYYQPQGNGDMPEKKDSLILQFYAPQTGEWSKVWGVEGGTVTEYKQVMLQITDVKYFLNNFQFRFVNKVSMSDNSKPGTVSNCDYWNIDYVYLNKDRTKEDTILHDIAFSYRPSSFLKEYEAMPWTHFITDKEKHINKENLFQIKNNDNVKRLIENMRLNITDLRTNVITTFEKGSQNINPNADFRFSLTDENFQFESTTENYAEFELKAELETDNFDYVKNNTISYKQVFYNYYAYDDGTAEMGWGLDGEGTKGGMVAYKFTNYKTEDNLIAVQFYFNRVLFDVNDNNFFILKVWADDSGRPGELLVEQFGLRPAYDEELNKFVQYDLDLPITVPETFYVGWEKTKNNMLNIGYDTDRRVSDKIFYNTGEEWIQYVPLNEGALMVRPVFGSFDNQPLDIEHTAADNCFDIYPNPASELLNIKFNNSLDASINIYNINGQLTYTTPASSQIDISTLQQGMYFVELCTKEGVKKRKKLIVR